MTVYYLSKEKDKNNIKKELDIFMNKKSETKRYLTKY